MRTKLILIASILGGFLFLKAITPETITSYDGQFYAAMTRELISSNPKTTTASYCYRILPAWLLHFVPLETKTSFTIYNAIIGLASAYLLFLLFVNSGYSYLESALGVFFFIFSWINVRLHFFYPVLVDATYYLIIIFAFQAMFRKKDSLFLISLTLGALTRENFFVLIPTYYFYKKERGWLWDGKAIRKTAVLATGPVIIFFLLRAVIPNTNPGFSYLKNIVYFARMSFLYKSRIIHSYLNVYGVVMFILLFHVPTVLRFLRRNLCLAVYLVISIIIPLFTGGDVCRYTFFSFPVILILGLQVMKEHRNIYRNKLMVGFLVASQLYLMRVFKPMVTGNYRQIWWSNISFCPEAIFRESCFRYAWIGIAFAVLYLGLYLRTHVRRPDSRPGRT